MSSSSEERDCDSCVGEFMSAGGCNALMDENMNSEELIPEGCNHCEEEAIYACMGNPA